MTPPRARAPRPSTQLLAARRPRTVGLALLVAVGVMAPTAAWAACATHLDCEDGDPCTLGYCTPSGCAQLSLCGDATSGSACEVDAHCDDGQACTVGTCEDAVVVGCKTFETVCTCDGWFECATDPLCLEQQCAEPLSLGTCSIAPRSCDDDNPCTEDTCEEPGGCAHPPVADGTTCNDGDACTVQDQCQGGACAGLPLACDDFRHCTTSTCETVVGPLGGLQCQQTNTPNPGWCLIGSQCVQEGRTNPVNPCQRCESLVSNTSWTDFSPPELCNGKDDNCNGLTDEGYDVGQPCEGPDPDQCVEEGGWRCRADTFDRYCADGPVGLWLFNPSPPGQTRDESGWGHHGATTDGQWDAQQMALYFNGESTSIQIPGNATLKLTHGHTIEFWVRPQPTSDYWGAILGQIRTSTHMSYMVRLGGMNSANWLVQNVYGCASTAFKAVMSATVPLDGTSWHHVAVTVDWAGRQRTYIDGQIAGDISACGGNVGSTENRPIIIGRRADTTVGDYYRGWMRRVALYDYARTPEQIAASVAKGSVPDIFFNEERCDYLDNDCDGLTDEGFGTDAPCDSWDADQCLDDRPVCAPLGLSSACWPTGPVGYFPFEEDAGPLALDYAGEGRDATLLGDAQRVPDARSGQQALQVSGTGGVEWSTASLDNSRLSLGVWLKPVGWAGGDLVARGIAQTQAVAASPGWLALRHAADGTMRVEAGATAALSWPAAGMLPEGQWTHVMATWQRERNRLRLYVNGALVKEARDVPWAAAPLPSKGRFGRVSGGAGGFVGVMDDATIYVRELPPGEVAALAASGVAQEHRNRPVCDGFDNDCNGITDEGFPLKDAPCDSDDSDFCENGTFTCTASGLGLECVNEDPTDIQEQCNGLDDDCDGIVDNGFPVGEPCDGDDSDFCENGTFTCTADGTWVECVNEDPSDIQEQCNGLDDDCDGIIDNGFPVGAPCDGDDSDLCENGTYTCKPDGSGVECVNEDPSDIQEQCNGLDDNCDGVVDSGFPVGEPCDGDDSDFCKNGTYTCRRDGSGVECINEDPTDIVELCNGQDDDCDGIVDNGFEKLGEPCPGPTGEECEFAFIVCTVDGLGTECSLVDAELVPEQCNGKDDNCNGLTDEGFPVGEPCDGDDSDQCENGTYTCTPDGSGVECINEDPSGIVEQCNGQDDDCDGVVDNGFPVGQPCDGDDSDFCANGTYTCTPDGMGVECINEDPTDIVERCNGQDDNCDGVVDSGFPVGEPCDDVDGVYCPHAVRVCTADELDTECSAGAFAEAPEQCNGIDDNCNGLTDEGFAVGEPCDGDDSDQCENGTYTCKPDGEGVECVNEDPSGVVEQCNGQDDDCDGVVDNGFPVGEPCDGDDSDQCENGTYTCKPDGSGVECINEDPTDIVEQCNGQDDDCDGVVDNGFPVGEPCDGPDGDQCAEGRYVCTADGTGVVCEADGPVLYYTFVDQQGLYARDESGWANDGERKNGASWWQGQASPGHVTQGMEFKRSSQQYLEVPHHPSLSISGSITLEAWIYIESMPSSARPYAGIVSKGNGPRNYSWYLTHEGGLHFSTGSPFCGSYTAAGVLVPRQWYHVAVVNALGPVQSHRHFVNGFEVASTTSGPDGACAFPVQTNTQPVRVGATEESHRWLDGIIAAVAVRDYALTAEEIAAHGASPWDFGPGNRELCDGVDNDCNGLTDEGYPLAGVEVGGLCVGEGVCGVGQVECASLFDSRCSTNPGGTQDQSSPEICDGVDNDCNGLTDESFAWYNPGSTAPRFPGAPCSGYGVCTGGVVECAGPHEVTCSVTPGGTQDKSSPEVCDGVDNDCNGLVDDGLTWLTFPLGGPCPGIGACGAGVVECSATGATTCSTLPDGSQDQSSAEQCDGIDNDCDGLTDEDFAYEGVPVGGACTGIGECGAGVVECTSLGSATCSTNPGGSADESQPEQCNGKDDDCNGFADDDGDGLLLVQECYTGPEGTQDQGICHGGLRLCMQLFFGGWSPCFGQTLPESSDAICNGLDENCNGLTDEDYSPLRCGIGACASESTCTDGTEHPCVPLPPAPDDSLCNGIDDDCDGQTDEDYAPVSCGLGVCANVSACVDGVEVPCEPLPPQGDDDDCDGIDQNCSGVPDDNYTDGIDCTLDLCVEGEAENIPDHGFCDDDNPCTVNTCAAQNNENGGCVTVADDTQVPPDDGLWCTVGYCEDGQPYYALMADHCLIDGACFANGDYDPADGCAVCYPPHGQHAWSDTLLETTFPSPALEQGMHVEVLHGGLAWATSTRRFTSHSLSAWFGDPESGTYATGERVAARLWLPERSLAPDALHVLRFELWLDTEQFTAHNGIDVLRVVARAFDDAAPEAPPVDTVLWDSTTALGGTTGNTWRTISVDLSAYAGVAVALAFEFDSGDGIFNDHEGPYLDDLRWTTACCFDNADCDDDDGCTLDQCDSSSGKSLCNWTHLCDPQCVPTLTTATLVVDRGTSMGLPLSGAGGASRWQSVVTWLQDALGEHEQDLNVAAIAAPLPGGAPCDVTGAEVGAGFHATAAEVIVYLQAQTPDAPQSGAAAGLLAAHAALAAEGYAGPHSVVLITSLSQGEATCPALLAAVQGLAADGVDVHVVGVGTGLAMETLNELAFAGGRPRAPDADGAYFYRARNLGQLMWALHHVLDTAAAEHCDGIDNDCDGATDEGITPRACNPECSGGGVQGCVAGVWQPCSAQPQMELCNGKDDDCNGITDDAWAAGDKGPPLGAPCSAGVGACERQGQYVCDAFDPFGPTICDAVPGPKAPEDCNGVDDNCNGLTDENLSQLCNTACGGGVQLCVGGAWAACSVPGAQPEICNGLDDNCDGSVDTNPDGTPLERPCNNGCAVGVEQCFNGVWMNCNAPEPGPEQCNGLDDNCNGLTDEGLDGGPLTEPCPDAEIVDPDAMGVCQLAARTCGVLVPGEWGPCDSVGTPSEEVCNGLDDDCNGLVDDAPGGGPLTMSCYDFAEGTPGVGPCQEGIRTCNAGAYGPCVGAVGPSPEQCNGIDDNCNGQTDENPGEICLDVPGCHTGKCKCAELSIGGFVCFLD